MLHCASCSPGYVALQYIATESRGMRVSQHRELSSHASSLHVSPCLPPATSSHHKALTSSIPRRSMRPTTPMPRALFPHICVLGDAALVPAVATDADAAAAGGEDAADAGTDAAGAATTEEEEDVGDDDDEAEPVHPLTDMPEASPHVTTAYVLTSAPGKAVVLGSPITILCGFINRGEASINVSTIMGSLNSPFDFVRLELRAGALLLRMRMMLLAIVSADAAISHCHCASICYHCRCSSFLAFSFCTPKTEPPLAPLHAAACTYIQGMHISRAVSAHLAGYEPSDTGLTILWQHATMSLVSHRASTGASELTLSPPSLSRTAYALPLAPPPRASSLLLVTSFASTRLYIIRPCPHTHSPPIHTLPQCYPAEIPRPKLQSEQIQHDGRCQL